MIVEINFVCRDDKIYRFKMDDISYYDLEYTVNVARVDFKDGSFIEFTRSNIICVEIVTKKFFDNGGGK